MKDGNILKVGTNEMELVDFRILKEEDGRIYEGIYGVNVAKVREIIRKPRLTELPGVSAFIEGIFDLRGTVIPLIDLRLKFGLPSEKMTENSRFMVMKNETETAGFVIDRLTEAIRLKKHEIGPAPETAMQEKTMIEGVGKQNDKILTILKVDKLLERDF